MTDKIKICLLTAIVAMLIAICYRMADLPHMEECAACGAHVTEVWHTQDANGELVHICKRCADNID